LKDAVECLGSGGKTPIRDLVTPGDIADDG